jgi:hypothetical protein
MRLTLLRLLLGYYWTDANGQAHRTVPPWDALDLCVSDAWIAHQKRTDYATG